MNTLLLKLKFIYKLFFAENNHWIVISLTREDFKKVEAGESYGVTLTLKNIPNDYFKGKIIDQVAKTNKFEYNTIARIEYEMILEQRKNNEPDTTTNTD